jgi:hypothetical protein
LSVVCGPAGNGDSLNSERFPACLAATIPAGQHRYLGRIAMRYTVPSLVKKLFARTCSQTPARRRPAVRPSVESLEDRWMLNATTITVDAAAGRRAIDPNIYGVNWGTTAGLADMNATLNRLGGTPASTYNWQQNASNRGNDYFFESRVENGDPTPGALGDNFVASSQQGGAAPILTVPTMDWVAKAPADPNGFLQVQNGDPNEAYVPNSPDFQKTWIDHLKSKFGDAANGGVRYYNLDNEPLIWNVTHSDIVTQPVSPDTIRDKIIAYASMIRQADPGAQILGPEEFNYWGYDYIPNLLQQLHQTEIDTGVRSLDYLSVHYYPQGDGAGHVEYDVVNGVHEDVTPETQLLRNRSTRSLWDPNYVDPGFGQTVGLIPKLHDWVNANYPGLKTALTEYNWGAEDHMNGATAEADALGIFGREGLDMANRWTAPAANTPVYNAFKMYRNYDGQRHTFGDQSVLTQAPDPDNVSAFGAVRSSDGALTVMVVNKALVDPADPGAQDTITVNLSNFAAAGTVQFYLLSAANPADLTQSTISQLPDGLVDGNGSFTVSVPRQSILLAVVTPGAPADPGQLAPAAGQQLAMPAAAPLAAAPAAVPQANPLALVMANGLSPAAAAPAIDNAPAGPARAPGLGQAGDVLLAAAAAGDAAPAAGQADPIRDVLAAGVSPADLLNDPAFPLVG